MRKKKRKEKKGKKTNTQKAIVNATKQMLVILNVATVVEEVGILVVPLVAQSSGDF